MNKGQFNVGDNVVVSATATGLGEDSPGWIDYIETFMGCTIISVRYLNPDMYGRWGITLRNPGLLTKVQ